MIFGNLPDRPPFRVENMRPSPVHCLLEGNRPQKNVEKSLFVEQRAPQKERRNPLTGDPTVHFSMVDDQLNSPLESNLVV